MPAITVIKSRRSTAAEWVSANPVLASGELGIETDTRKLKAGNGSTAWNSLGYINAGSTEITTIINQDNPFSPFLLTGM